MKTITIAVLFNLVLPGCINYADDRPKSIGMVDTKISSRFIYEYYDSIPNSTWNRSKDKWQAEFNLATDPQVNKKVYYFPSPHEEMYRVGFTWPIVICAVYNDSARTWLYGDKVSESEALRMKKRFETDIISPIVDYAKKRGIKMQ